MIYANRFFVYDSLLIVRNNPKSQKNLIEIRNLRTMVSQNNCMRFTGRSLAYS